MKTWREIRTAALGLGFEKTKAYEKNKQSYIDRYNWRQTYIAGTIGGIEDVISVEKTEKEKMTVDLYRQTKKDDKLFSSVSQTGVCDEKGYRLEDVYITDNRFLHLPKEYTGQVNVYYICLPVDITTSTPDTTQCTLPEKWISLMPYLMANRLYLDDDRGKAGYYWNMFEDMKNSLLAMENMPMVTVNGGVDIDGIF